MPSLWEILEYKKEKRHIYILLLSAPVLLSVYYYHGSSSGFQQLFPVYAAQDATGVFALYWRFLLFFLLMGAMPLLYGCGVEKWRASDLGLGLGDWKTGLRVVAITIPVVIVPLIWVAAGTPGLSAEYPMLRSLFQDSKLFIPYELAYVVLYYTAWEFYFRGFLLFPLSREFGGSNAILIQTISSCLIHLGKPESETMGSIAAGIIFGALALRTQSIWYAFILHATIGVLTDFFVLLQAGTSF